MKINTRGGTMTKTKKTPEIDHAKRNALGWLESIEEMVGRLGSDDEKISEAAREEIQESALEVSVRSGWHSPGGNAKPDEYLVLLSTGGPACRITGYLDQYGQPTSVSLQYQDWGTPWTDLDAGNEHDDAMLQFVGCFYFGE